MRQATSIQQKLIVVQEKHFINYYYHLSFCLTNTLDLFHIQQLRKLPIKMSVKQTSKRQYLLMANKYMC